MALYNDEQEFEQNAHEARIQAFRDKYKGVTDLKTLVLAMQNAQQRKVAIEADLKNVNAEFDVLRFEMVPEVMDTQGVERVSYDGVGRVSLTPDVRVTLPNEQKDNFQKWCTKRKMGDLFQLTVNASTLKAWIKNRIKTGKEYPVDMLKVTPITRASITKG